jgi:hypothetical protein
LEFFRLESAFFCLWWIGVFVGVFEFFGAQTWCFGGEFVVECVAGMVA